MTEAAPRSWRSIVFRPGRPPMRKRTAMILCVVFLLVNVIVDILLLTNAHVLGRIAEVQIRKHAGEVVAFEDLTMTLGGNLRMDHVAVKWPDPASPFLSSRRVRISIGHRDGGIVAESVIFDEPRIRFSDKIAKSIEGEAGAARKPLNELISARHLPRISCRGGTLELGHSDVLAGEDPQVFHILDLAMVPTTGYRYFVRGTLRNSLVGEWGVQGEVDLDTGDHRVYLTNKELTLGDPLRHALKPSLQEAWDKYKPIGKAGVDILLACDKANPSGDPPFRLTLRPRGMSLVYKAFPYPCDQVTGEMEFRSDGFTVKGITGTDGKSTKFRFDGSADGYDGSAGYHFRLEMDQLRFDDTLKNALQPEAREVWAQFKPSGKLDARVTIHRERGGPEIKESVPVDLHLRGASLTYAGFPYQIDQATGEIRIDGDNVFIRRLKGVHDRAELSIAGWVDSISNDPTMDIDVRALTLDLDARLRHALAPATREIFDRVGASGEVDLDARITRSKGGEPVIRASVRARSNRVVFKDAPLPVVVREGTVEINDGRVRLHHLKGLVDPIGEVQISGDITPGASGTTTHLEIDGLGVPIDDRFRDRMPKAVGETLRSLQVSGIADFKFTFDERPERDRTGTRVRLQLDLRKGSIASGVPVEDIDGTIVIVGPIRDGRPLLSGRIDIRSARIVKKQIKNLTTNFTIQGSSLDFRDIAGDAYGGKVSGWFSLDTVTNDLDGDFTVSRLDLKDFINDTAKWSGKTISGKVDLRIPNLSGKSNDLETLKSEGASLLITEGQLLDVPGIVNFLDPMRGAGYKFTAMKAFFDMRNGKFKIHEFAFLGQEGGGAVIGQGDFWFDGHFKLKVSTETASLFGIPFIFAKVPGLIIDLFKKPFKKVFEGDLESSKLFEE